MKWYRWCWFVSHRADVPAFLLRKLKSKTRQQVCTAMMTLFRLFKSLFVAIDNDVAYADNKADAALADAAVFACLLIILVSGCDYA